MFECFALGSVCSRCCRPLTCRANLAPSSVIEEDSWISVALAIERRVRSPLPSKTGGAVPVYRYLLLAVALRKTSPAHPAAVETRAQKGWGITEKAPPFCAESRTTTANPAILEGLEVVILHQGCTLCVRGRRANTDERQPASGRNTYNSIIVQ